MMKRGKDYIGVGVGAVIINDNNEIVLLLRQKTPEAGFWSIPGGTVEFAERLEEAVVREVQEELGVKCDIIALLGVTNHIVENEGTHWVAPAFLVKIVSGEPRNMEPQCHAEMKWFPVDGLPENQTMTTSVALHNLRKYLAQNSTR